MATAPQLSPLEQLTAGQHDQGPPAGSELSPLEQLINTPSQQAQTNPGAAIQPVTNQTNPKLNVNASGENMPEYVGATGAAGAALMGAAETGGALGAGVKALIPAATRGVVGIGQWAAEHPMTAKAIWEGLKLAFYGKILHSAGKVIDSAPDR